MTNCPHTGLSRPECSCRACLQAQVEQYRPSLLAGPVAAPVAAPELSIPTSIEAGLRPRGRRAA